MPSPHCLSQGPQFLTPLLQSPISHLRQVMVRLVSSRLSVMCRLIHVKAIPQSKAVLIRHCPYIEHRSIVRQCVVMCPMTMHMGVNCNDYCEVTFPWVRMEVVESQGIFYQGEPCGRLEFVQEIGYCVHFCLCIIEQYLCLLWVALIYRAFPCVVRGHPITLGMIHANIIPHTRYSTSLCAFAT